MNIFKIAGLAAVVIVCYVLSPTTSQRQLRPIGEFDMSENDAALLCAKIEMENNNITSGEPDTKPFQPEGFCYFFQWIYCPNVPEDMEKPCGWWEQKVCNYTVKGPEPHFALEPANPDAPPPVPDPAPVPPGDPAPSPPTNPPPGDAQPPPGDAKPPPGEGQPPPGEGQPPPGEGQPPPGEGQPLPGDGSAPVPP